MNTTHSTIKSKLQKNKRLQMSKEAITKIIKSNINSRYGIIGGIKMTDKDGNKSIAEMKKSKKEKAPKVKKEKVFKTPAPSGDYKDANITILRKVKEGEKVRPQQVVILDAMNKTARGNKTTRKAVVEYLSRNKLLSTNYTIEDNVKWHERDLFSKDFILVEKIAEEKPAKESKKEEKK